MSSGRYYGYNPVQQASSSSASSQSSKSAAMSSSHNSYSHPSSMQHQPPPPPPHLSSTSSSTSAGVGQSGYSNPPHPPPPPPPHSVYLMPHHQGAFSMPPPPPLMHSNSVPSLSSSGNAMNMMNASMVGARNYRQMVPPQMVQMSMQKQHSQNPNANHMLHHQQHLHHQSQQQQQMYASSYHQQQQQQQQQQTLHAQHQQSHYTKDGLPPLGPTLLKQSLSQIMVPSKRKSEIEQQESFDLQKRQKQDSAAGDNSSAMELETRDFISEQLTFKLSGLQVSKELDEKFLLWKKNQTEGAVTIKPNFMTLQSCETARLSVDFFHPKMLSEDFRSELRKDLLEMPNERISDQKNEDTLKQQQQQLPQEQKQQSKRFFCLTEETEKHMKFLRNLETKPKKQSQYQLQQQQQQQQQQLHQQKQQQHLKQTASQQQESLGYSRANNNSRDRSQLEKLNQMVGGAKKLASSRLTRNKSARSFRRATDRNNGSRSNRLKARDSDDSDDDDDDDNDEEDDYDDDERDQLNDRGDNGDNDDDEDDDSEDDDNRDENDDEVNNDKNDDSNDVSSSDSNNSSASQSSDKLAARRRRAMAAAAKNTANTTTKRILLRNKKGSRRLIDDSSDVPNAMNGMDDEDNNDEDGGGTAGDDHEHGAADSHEMISEENQKSLRGRRNSKGLRIDHSVKLTRRKSGNKSRLQIEDEDDHETATGTAATAGKNAQDNNTASRIQQEDEKYGGQSKRRGSTIVTNNEKNSAETEIKIENRLQKFKDREALIAIRIAEYEKRSKLILDHQNKVLQVRQNFLISQNEQRHALTNLDIVNSLISLS